MSKTPHVFHAFILRFILYISALILYIQENHCQDRVFSAKQAGLRTGNQDSISSRVSALTRTVLGKSMAHTKTHQLLWDYW